jgi:hypothetical protein
VDPAAAMEGAWAEQPQAPAYRLSVPGEAAAGYLARLGPTGDHAGRGRDGYRRVAVAGVEGHRMARRRECACVGSEGKVSSWSPGFAWSARLGRGRPR